MAMDVGVTSHLAVIVHIYSIHFNRHKGHMLPMVVVVVPVGVTRFHTFHADFGTMCPMAVCVATSFHQLPCHLCSQKRNRHKGHEHFVCHFTNSAP